MIFADLESGVVLLLNFFYACSPQRTCIFMEYILASEASFSHQW